MRATSTAEAILGFVHKASESLRAFAQVPHRVEKDRVQTGGIEPSHDPVLKASPAAHSVSYRRHRAFS
jgi:hypothetical protein